MQSRFAAIAAATLLAAVMASASVSAADRPMIAPARTAATPRLVFSAAPADVTGSAYVLLSWNDLGMHCMNRDHAQFSVLPPFNNLEAQLIRRGDASNPPALITTGATVEYSIPGNSYSVGKTDFWSHAQALFGVALPPNIGLTGRGLTGTFDLLDGLFSAVGIPVTPFPDATPTVEHPYQQALVIAHDTGGNELARSTPTIPVSVELGCLASGCHASEAAILQGHERVAGFDPNATPILCASCHADPALGAPGKPEAGYFSMRIHEAHTFMDEQGSGTAVCYKCHPGQNARCLRGVMATRFAMQCQDCHGNMAAMKASIDGGRIPWLQEPACRTCHTARFGEPVGQLFRKSTGHGGIACEGCHHSTHSEWPSAEAADNANVLALQGTAAPLGNCAVCHGTYPTGSGPHDILATGVADELLHGARTMSVIPNPARAACTIRFRAGDATRGLLLVFDSSGRTVRLLRPRHEGGDRWSADWDALNARGARVSPGVYFIRWQDGADRAAAQVTMVR